MAWIKVTDRSYRALSAATQGTRVPLWDGAVWIDDDLAEELQAHADEDGLSVNDEIISLFEVPS